MKNSDQTSLEPIEIVDVVTILGQITEGRDAETYKADLLRPNGKTVTGYVKLTSDPRKIIAELVSSQLGHALGLKIPRPFLAILDTSIIPDDISCRFTGTIACFASKQAGKRTYSLERCIQGSDLVLSGAIANFNLNETASFDELIANDDRHLGNIVYAPDKQECWLIDHGRALTGSYWDLWGLDDPTVSVNNVLVDKPQQQWDEPMRRQVIKDAIDLVAKCSQVAMDELDMDGHIAKIDPSTDRQEIINFLQARIHHTVSLLCQRLGIHQLPFPPQTH